MNDTPESSNFDRRFVNNMVESALRIGLFIGAVVLAVWYKLFQLWISQTSAT